MTAAAEVPCGPKVRIGNITFTVLRAPETPENKARWDRRAEALSELLLALWRKEQQRPGTAV